MTDKPQLSAEMEKRFREEAIKISSFLIEELNSVDGNAKHITIEWGGMMHFLATALEEQRTKMVQKLENLDNKSVKFVNNTFRSGYQRSIKDILAILNGKTA